MKYEKLKKEVRETLRERNSWLEKHGLSGKKYEAKVREHRNGPAIDVRYDGEAAPKLGGWFNKAAMRAGYVVVGTKVFEEFPRINGGKTRLFLRPVGAFFSARTSTRLQPAGKA